MPTFTTTDVNFDEYRVKREIVNGATFVYATIGYEIITQQGRIFRGESRVELTGTAKTQAANLLQSIKDLVKAGEGL